MYFRMLLRMLRTFVRQGSLTIIDAEGQRHVFSGEPGPRVTARIHDPAFYRRFLVDPDLTTGEAYMDGTLTFEEDTDLRDLFRLYFMNQRNIEAHPLRKFFNGLSYRLRRWHLSNKLGGQAKKNVSHHYDIGNDLYRLFLDPTMTYSCAYFRSPDDTLEQAQRNKLRLAAAKLDLRPGQHVLDIGSGWGDMGIYLAQMEDVEVTGVTLSKEQYELSNEKARAAGLGDRVRFELKDYRDLDGTFDRIVSIGMFEHVG
ncbi:MAG: cyclopropane-fatty-acyl-phospholipid synthase family protein, partial [Pseudomonadota bacterium]|nr:cyclopropane-fatty-acyl-phospholipid synthase family protein [Pseudomonadota bacterium]